MTFNNRSYLVYFFIILSLLFSLFPWLSFSLNSFDMQPWVLFLYAIVVGFFICHRVHKVIFLFYLFFLVVVLLSMLDFGYYSIRAIASYFLLFLGFHYFYIIFKYYPKVFSNVIFFSNLIWIFFGLLQVLFGLEILSSIVNLRSSGDRGVTSLSPEPTHFGFHLVFITWILLLLSHVGFISQRRAYAMAFLNFIAILFLAKSSMGAIYFLLMIPFYFFSVNFRALSLIYILIFLIFFFFGFYIYLLIDGDSRLSVVMSSIIQDPLAVARDDASINTRLSHAILTVIGSFSSFFYPHGFSNFEAHSYLINQSIGGFFWYKYESNVIMSGTGSLIYELGIIGLVFLFILLLYMMGLRKFNFMGFLSFLLLWLLMFGAIPVSYPLLPAVATLVYFINVNKFNIVIGKYYV